MITFLKYLRGCHVEKGLDNALYGLKGIELGSVVGGLLRARFGLIYI